MAQKIAVILVAYAAGCLTAGYYLVRFASGEDVRSAGSGSAGATNVGRKLGAWGFGLTLLLDAAKGAAAVGAARYLDFGPPTILLVLLAVTAGHVWPAQLRFRGGKGIAPLLGGALMFDYRLALATALLAAAIFIFLRRFDASGTLAVAAAPAVGWSLGYPAENLPPLAALAALVLIAHRENFRAAFRRRPAFGRAAEPAPQRRTP